MSNQATGKQKVFLYVTLLIISAAVAFSTIHYIWKMQNKKDMLLSVPFSPSPDFDLSILPPFINYDFSGKFIFIKGALTEEDESKILSVFSSNGNISTESSASFLKFKSAIVLIVEKSDELKNELSTLIFYVALLGGALGSTLRIFLDFVGNASYKDELNFQRWWPLYFTRPVTGALLGLIVIILLKSNIMSLTLNSNHSDSLWWLGLAILSGFGTIDATERLRLTSKAIFGDSKSQSKGDNKQ